MKSIKYIVVLSIALLGLWCSNEVKAGNLVSVASSFTVAVTDTAGPSTETVAHDTIRPSVAPTELAVADTNDTDPPAANNATPSIAAGEINEDLPASDLYEDFDTTLVHADKFDALTFDDTVAIALNDPAHCEYTMPFDGRMTSSFAFRKYRYHFGVDIDLNTGDTIRCAFDGKVRIAQKSKSYGWVVVVRHSNGLETYYAHMSKLLVHPNEELEAGAVLGLGGNTGHSYGSHLHFEVRFRGQPIDPNYLIDFEHGRLRCDTYYLTKSDFKYLSKTYKVRHYSKKRKKTWYTYYNAGGPHYATPEAKRIMDAVPDPKMPGSGNAEGTTSNSGTTVPAKTPPPAAKKPPTTTTPAKTSSTTSSSTPKVRQPIDNGAAVYYTIKSGDTLYALALKNHTTVAKLCSLNHISASSTLKVGQKIRLK